MFGVNMTFISSSEVKNVYFMSAEGTNEIYPPTPHLPVIYESIGTEKNN